MRGHRWRQDYNAIATQAMRVHLGETVGDDKIRGWLRERGEPDTWSDISAFREDMLGPNRPRLIAPDAILIREGIKLALGPLGERLADRMSWSLVRSEEARVLTSDEPVCWWAPGDDPVGYSSAKVIWLPLSPRVILQLRDADATPAELGLPSTATPEGRDELCRLVNREVAGQAHRWIIHHPEDAPVEDISLPPRTVWGDQLVDVRERDNERRELWIHRRLPADRVDNDWSRPVR